MRVFTLSLLLCITAPTLALAKTAQAPQPPQAPPLQTACNCGEHCPCRGTPTGLSETPPTAGRELIILSASWCAPCRALHKWADDLDGVRFIDIDTARTEAIALWGSVPSQLPVFVTLQDGRPVHRWQIRVTSRDQLISMRDVPSLPSATPSRPQHHSPLFFQPTPRHCSTGGCP